MKQSMSTLAPAKGALIMCGLSVALALSLAGGLAYYRSIKDRAAAQTSAEVAGISNENQTFTDDLAFLESNLAAFKRLARNGLLGKPEREAWVQRLESIYESMALPPTLRCDLEIPKPFVIKAATAGVETQASQTDTTQQNAASPAVLGHDLHIELSGIHEEEFLTFMDKLSTDWKTTFRIESCTMTRRDPNDAQNAPQNDPEKGLLIKCTLRIFSLAPAAADQPAASQ